MLYNVYFPMGQETIFKDGKIENLVLILTTWWE